MDLDGHAFPKRAAGPAIDRSKGRIREEIGAFNCGFGVSVVIDFETGGGLI